MAIELDDVSHVYPGGARAVDGVSLRIGDGERVAIIGQNGAGKTTTVKLMNGLLRPTTGRVLLDGADTVRRTTASLARQVAYVFQNPDDQLFGRDVFAEVSFAPRLLKLDADAVDARVQRALELTGLEGTEDDNPQDFPLAVRKFVAIAAVLASDARSIILDEPTAGLDAAGKERLRRILDTLADEGVAVITISHDMRYVADHFPRVVVMRQGRIVIDATREEVFASDEALTAARLQRPPAVQLARDLGILDPALGLPEIARLILARRSGA